MGGPVPNKPPPPPPPPFLSCQVWLAVALCFRGKFVGVAGFLKTWLPLLLVLSGVFYAYGAVGGLTEPRKP